MDIATSRTGKEAYTTVQRVQSVCCQAICHTAALPEFRTEVRRPFQYTGVDFAGPLKYNVNKREEKAYVLMFTCATSRAVHLEFTRTQSAEEFPRKLNAFITRRTRPQVIISDNAATFKATATWI